jgi:uncharacterized protein (UPF0332 family)
MNTPVEQLIQYRSQQANDSLLEVQALLESSFWPGAINRAYYAMFYVVMALAVLRQEATSKRSGTIAFFDREFVKVGIFPKELSQSLHLAFQKRQEHDYGEVFTCTQEEAYQAIVEAKASVGAVILYLASTHP